LNNRSGFKTSVWVKFFVFVGLACIVQFFVFALIGFFRGYSVQSWIPYCVMLVWVVVLIISWAEMMSVDKVKAKKYQWISFLVSFSIIFSSITSIFQTRYSMQGDALFNEKKYVEAIAAFEKATGSWYLHGCYNNSESASLFKVAESYCQLEEFDLAGEMYLLIAQRYRGYFAKRSATEAEEMDAELKNIADLQERFDGEIDDDEKAQILFDIALAYRKIACDKKAKEQYELIQGLDARQIFKDSAKKFAEDF